jgi:hypothetical protein
VTGFINNLIYVTFYPSWFCCLAKAISSSTEKPSGQYLGLICDESLTCRGLNSKSRHFDGSTTFTFVSCGESRLFVSCCACGKCGMADNDEDRGKSRSPGAEDQGWSSTS